MVFGHIRVPDPLVVDTAASLPIWHTGVCAATMTPSMVVVFFVDGVVVWTNPPRGVERNHREWTVATGGLSWLTMQCNSKRNGINTVQYSKSRRMQWACVGSSSVQWPILSSNGWMLAGLLFRLCAN